MIILTSAAAGRQEIAPRQKMHHAGFVRGIVHLPDGRRVITCSNDSALRVWDLESGLQIGHRWQDERDNQEMTTITLSPDGSILASVSGGGDGKMRLWDVGTGKVIAKWTSHWVTSLCWSPDGKRLVSGSLPENTTKLLAGEARVWDGESGKIVLGPIKTGHVVYGVTYSPDGKMIAIGGASEALQLVSIWDAESSELLSILDTLLGFESARCLAWTSDGKKLVVGTRAQGVDSIRVFDTTGWNQTAFLQGHSDIIWDIALSRNNRILASAAWDHTVCLWDLNANLQIGLPLWHGGGLDCAAFSADGKVLTTGGRGGNVYVWDVPAIVREAGFDFHDLFSTPRDVHKSLLDVDVTQNPGFGDTHQLPGGFFDDTQDGVHFHEKNHSQPQARQQQGQHQTPGVVIKNPGWWTRVKLFICCISVDYTTDNPQR